MLVAAVKKKYRRLSPHLDERTLRLWAANEALALGHGGASAVAQAVGISRTTRHAGLRELSRPPTRQEAEVAEPRIRRPGGGRKSLIEKDRTLLRDLESLVEPVTRGDPDSPLRWTCRSTTRLAEDLRARRHAVSQRTVCNLLAHLGYSLQANKKTREGASHPDRDTQFAYIARTVKAFQRRGQPVISVDTKKKELVGNFKNPGRSWRRKQTPLEVNLHDFADLHLGKVVPYGVYDVSANQGWVSVGIDHDTAQFAVETIRRWWREMGRPLYPQAREILVTADCGGSNGHRVRLWKVELQKLADELGLKVHVCHFPPGTSKWNKIEHRMFCCISQNWKGRPLSSREVIVNLISNTTTKTGLRIKAALDESQYQTKIRVSNKELEAVAITESDFHGEWNYRIDPRATVRH